MKSTGITRKVDELGRVVIPKELRRILEMEVKDPIEIFVNNEEVILKKYKPNNTCMITGEVRDDNISLQNGKIVLSPEGAKIVEHALNKFLTFEAKSNK